MVLRMTVGLLFGKVCTLAWRTFMKALREI
jgi:hypothetical protein